MANEPDREKDSVLRGVSLWDTLQRPVPFWLLSGLLLLWLYMVNPPFVVNREKARETSCMSNEKQIGLAFAQYAEDYDGYFPDAAQWMTATRPYVKSDGIYHCPDTSGTAPGYAFNSLLARRNVTKIGDPAHTVVAFESDRRTINAADPLFSLSRPGRHDGKTDQKVDMILFADFHVKALAPEDIPGAHP